MSQNIFRTGACNARQCGTPVDALFCERHLTMIPPALRHVVAASSDPDGCPPALITAAIEAIAHKESRAAPSTPRIPAPKPTATAEVPPQETPARTAAAKSKKTQADSVGAFRTLDVVVIGNVSVDDVGPKRRPYVPELFPNRSVSGREIWHTY